MCKRHNLAAARIVIIKLRIRKPDLMKFLQSFVHLFWNTSIFSALSSQLWHSHLNRFHHSSLLLKPFYWTWFSWWKMIKTGTMRQEKIKLGKVWAQTQKVEESSKHLVSSGVQIYKMFMCGWSVWSVDGIHYQWSKSWFESEHILDQQQINKDQGLTQF